MLPPIEFLKEAGVEVRLSGPNKLTATGYLTDDICQYIQTHKREIISALSARNAPPPRPPTRTVLHYRLTDARGGNKGGMIIADDLADAVLDLVARYRSHLDLEDLLERVQERFCIAAESAPDAEALRVALAEAEAVIRRAAQKERKP
ncbi:hypothetical protein [Crenobacter caeni]|uniref:Uncharacterized protein n=1 Tax=Crenobacter caeni TaxID=2705474 RepID=A0A6B2KTW2_9NEIS|nr:hypothetical protein [Crenobacter caeni]NDV13544.1 hypothetical protein [Crenobacter caeni]